MAKQKDTENIEELESSEPVALVGSGAPQVRVRALTNVYGLSYGQVSVFPKSDKEVKALIAAGHLEIVKDEK